MQKPSALPMVGREYHEFFRAPRFRWWKPLLSLLMFVSTWFIATIVVSFAAIFYDWGTGRVSPSDTMAGKLTVTPALFAANNIALALAIPLAGLTAWAVFGQRPRWISSITGGFRWRLFWRYALIAAPIFLLGLGVEVLIGGVPKLEWNPDSAFLIVAILLTTPFQAAGEEYGVRGLLARSVGSWFGSSRVGLVVATAVSSLVFMGLHDAQDVWLNTYYFLVGVVCSILVWRTGGLEAAVALHICNNLISEITLPFSSLDGLFDRGVGSAGPEILIQLVFTLSVMGGMLWLAARRKVPTVAAPGAQARRIENSEGYPGFATNADKGAR